jgi:hypothetical protein
MGMVPPPPRRLPSQGRPRLPLLRARAQAPDVRAHQMPPPQCPRHPAHASAHGLLGAAMSIPRVETTEAEEGAWGTGRRGRGGGFVGTTPITIREQNVAVNLNREHGGAFWHVPALAHGLHLNARPCLCRLPGSGQRLDLRSTATWSQGPSRLLRSRSRCAAVCEALGGECPLGTTARCACAAVPHDS